MLNSPDAASHLTSMGAVLRFKSAMPENIKEFAITVLARGSVLAEGDYAAVSRNPDVVAAYLGSEAPTEAAHG